MGFSIEAIPGRRSAPHDEFQSYTRMGQFAVDNKSLVQECM